MSSLRDENFYKQPKVILLKNGCFVRHTFCTIFASLSLAEVLEKHFQSSS